MAKKAYVYSGTDWVPLASEVTDLTPYQTIANSQAPFRNLIINGAMQVAQRGTSVSSVTSSGYYTVDRFTPRIGSFGTWTISQESDGPTGSGFTKSLKFLCTTADASPASGDTVEFQHRIEGQNLQSVRKGTADAQQLTLSFWVKSNVTGTFIAELRDIDNNRSISATYTINSSATWEKKTITYAADTTGAFDNDNNRSLDITWWLGAGTDFTSGTLNTSWATMNNPDRAVGVSNLASATSNYWQITGVQLEVGAVATPFEFKPYAQDLAECQRYYEIVGSGGIGMQRAGTTIGATMSWQFKTEKRAQVTLNHIANFTIGAPGLNGPYTVNAINSIQANNPHGFMADLTTSTTSGTLGSNAQVTSSTTNGYIGASAEL